MKTGNILLLAALAILLVPSLWFAWQGLRLDVDIPPEVYPAIFLGIIGTLAIGGGLMWLVFYSARHGYDEAPKQTRDDR